MEWNERNCRNCKKQLGCIHSKLSKFAIEPTDDVKPIIMRMWCNKLKIREDAER